MLNDARQDRRIRLAVRRATWGTNCLHRILQKRLADRSLTYRHYCLICTSRLYRMRLVSLLHMLLPSDCQSMPSGYGYRNRGVVVRSDDDLPMWERSHHKFGRLWRSSIADCLTTSFGRVRLIGRLLEVQSIIFSMISTSDRWRNQVVNISFRPRQASRLHAVEIASFSSDSAERGSAGIPGGNGQPIRNRMNMRKRRLKPWLRSIRCRCAGHPLPLPTCDISAHAIT